MRNPFFTVFKKEVLDTLRDRRALTMIGLFVVMYPAMLWFMGHKIIEKSTQAERESIEVVVIGAQQVPSLLDQFKQRNVIVTPREDMDNAAIGSLLKQRKFSAVLRVPAGFSESYQAMRPATIELWSDSSEDGQGPKLRKIEGLLRGYNNTIAAARLLAHGVSPATLSPVLVQNYDTADSQSRSASFIGSMLGVFFAAAFFFGMNTAMDSTAGERERRSLEVLLAQPARPFDILAGKWLATAAIAFTGLTLELLAAHAVLSVMPLEEIGMSWRLGLPQILLVCAAALPLCLFAAAAEIALAMNAKSFKEAQATMGFAMLIPMLPVIIVPSMNLTTQLWMYAVPVLGNQTLLLEMAKGNSPGFAAFAVAMAACAALAVAAISFAAWRLKSEKYVLSV